MKRNDHRIQKKNRHIFENFTGHYGGIMEMVKLSSSFISRIFCMFMMVLSMAHLAHKRKNKSTNSVDKSMTTNSTFFFAVSFEYAHPPL